MVPRAKRSFPRTPIDTGKKGKALEASFSACLKRKKESRQRKPGRKVVKSEDDKGVAGGDSWQKEPQNRRNGQ